MAADMACLPISGSGRTSIIIITNNSKYRNTIESQEGRGGGFLAFDEVAIGSSNPKCLRNPTVVNATKKMLLLLGPPK